MYIPTAIMGLKVYFTAYCYYEICLNWLSPTLNQQIHETRKVSSKLLTSLLHFELLLPQMLESFTTKRQLSPKSWRLQRISYFFHSKQTTQQNFQEQSFVLLKLYLLNI
jgi:hypothetical protein